MHTLINRRKVREYAMERAKFRAHKFTRVGNDFYGKCETNLRAFIQGYLHRHPSKGKTIR